MYQSYLTFRLSNKISLTVVTEYTDKSLKQKCEGIELRCDWITKTTSIFRTVDTKLQSI